MYLLAIIGGTFYLTKFPENKCPGKQQAKILVIRIDLYSMFVLMLIPKQKLVKIMYHYNIAFCLGRVDFLGSSHQWWHIMVLIGYVWTHHCTKVIFLYWKDNSCMEHSTNHQLN